MVNRWRYVSKIALFTFLAKIMALVRGTAVVGNNVKSSDL